MLGLYNGKPTEENVEKEKITQQTTKRKVSKKRILPVWAEMLKLVSLPRLTGNGEISNPVTLTS